MTATHKTLNAKLDRVTNLRQTIALKGHELLRRAAIPATADGYPRRASGSEPPTTPAPLVDVQWDMQETGWWLYVDGHRSGPYPTASEAWDAGPGRTIDYSDPTGETAVTGQQPSRRDPVSVRALTMERHLDAAIASLEHAVNQLDDASPDDGGPWCESCLRHHGPDGTPSFSPIHPRIKTRTDVGGRLKDQIWICRWCYDWVRVNSALPDREVLIQYLERGRVRITA